MKRVAGAALILALSVTWRYRRTLLRILFRVAPERSVHINGRMLREIVRDEVDKNNRRLERHLKRV